MNDPVGRPAHYNSGKIEVIEAIEDWALNFHRGNAVKYTARAGKKDSAKEIEDLEKAVWYLEREIERLKAKRESRDPIRPNDMRPRKKEEFTSATDASSLDHPAGPAAIVFDAKPPKKEPKYKCTRCSVYFARSYLLPDLDNGLVCLDCRNEEKPGPVNVGICPCCGVSVYARDTIKVEDRYLCAFCARQGSGSIT